GRALRAWGLGPRKRGQPRPEEARRAVSKGGTVRAVVHASRRVLRTLLSMRWSMKLAGKVALVTGAQQGIGTAIALALAGEGADVAINWLDDEKAADAVAGGVRQYGRRAALIRADMAKLSDIETMVAETTRQLRPPALP